MENSRSGNYSVEDLLTMIAQDRGLLPYITPRLPAPPFVGSVEPVDTSAPWDVFTFFILGVVYGGIFVAPTIVFFVCLFIMPRYCGFVWTGSDAQITGLFYWWLGLTGLCGAVAAFMARYNIH